ncbi:MAG: hypothetical protein J7K51_06845 [Thermotogae bacterium]|nr:hypothetical protein [Thermotogota bacterium]
MEIFNIRNKCLSLLLLLMNTPFILSFSAVIFSIYGEAAGSIPDFSNPRRYFVPGEKIYFTLRDTDLSAAPYVSILGNKIGLEDDGTDGDLLANDGVFTGRYTLPASLADEYVLNVGYKDILKKILIDKNNSANCYKEILDKKYRAIDFGEGSVLFQFISNMASITICNTSSSSIDKLYRDKIDSSSFTFQLWSGLTDDVQGKLHVSQGDIVDIEGYSTSTITSPVQKIIADYSPHIYDFSTSPRIWQGEGDVTIGFKTDIYPLNIKVKLRNHNGNVIDDLTKYSDSNYVEIHWDIKDKMYESGEYYITVICKTIDTEEHYAPLLQSMIKVELGDREKEDINIRLFSNIIVGVSKSAVFIVSPATEIQRATIFDLNGRKVKELAESENISVLRWDGLDFMGEPVSSGIYMLVIFREGKKPVMKMVGVKR